MAVKKGKKSNVSTTTTTKAAPVATAQAAVSTAKTAASAAKTEVTPAKKETVVAAPAEKKVEPAKTVTDTKPAAKEEKKPAAKKPAAKRATRKTAKKPVETVQEVFFQYAGEQIHTEELVERIKEVYKNEGHRLSSIKTLRVYIKPEERKAYYVINDGEGKSIDF